MLISKTRTDKQLQILVNQNNEFIKAFELFIEKLKHRVADSSGKLKEQKHPGIKSE